MVPGQSLSTLIIHRRSRREEPLQSESWRNLGEFLQDRRPLRRAHGHSVSPPQLRDLLAASPTSPEFFLALDRHTAFGIELLPALRRDTTHISATDAERLHHDPYFLALLAFGAAFRFAQ
jgi:hypothetical protein